MKMSNFPKNTLVTAIGAALAMGFASQASAISPQFTIDPTVIPSSSIFAPFMSSFNADFVSGNTSELVTLHPGPNTATATGWANFQGYTLGGGAISPITTGVGVDYNLYLNYSLADTWNGDGTFGGTGSTYTVNVLDFVLLADPNSDTTFSNANATTDTNATVGGTTADDIVLASGSILTGVAGIDALGGAYSNITDWFAVCTGAGTADVGGTSVADGNCSDGTGSSYFAAPVPFFTLAFSEFNNTSQGVLYGTDASGNTILSVTNASGGVDFNKVPEPATLGLLGLGLLGMGASLFKRKAG